jgi:hypothetical protein
MAQTVPLDFNPRTTLQHAANNNGWYGAEETAGNWLFVASTSAPGRIGLAALGPFGPWLLAVSQANVARELDLPPAPVAPPAAAGMVAVFVLADPPALH